MLEDSAEDLYENAPCGYLSTLLDGQIAKVNATLLGWLGYSGAELVGKRAFGDLLTVGGRLYHETHVAPLLRMRGEVSGIALELVAADGARLPVLATSVIKSGVDGAPLLIRTTLFDASSRRAYEAELLRARRAAEQERERLQRLNAILQRTLLPSALEPVPGLDVAAHYHIASLDQVGGDFYDLFPLADARWGFFLGDVCGKGALAATLTSRVRYALRAAAVYDPDPGSVLTKLNRVLLDSHQPGDPRFCTVLYGGLVLRDGRAEVTLAAGGHPPALLLRACGAAEYLRTPGGQLVGLLPDAEVGTARVVLHPGDTLLLYTDGLIEARTGTGLFGEEALLEFAAARAPRAATALVADLVGLLESLGAGVTDDTALLALHLPGKPVDG
ncbi:SpoIIE family protein phosphatase [Nocardia asteroides]|uniref:SpoIIE family protein phosphatase n=1 Tax=Nocardia asteroides TaxID=1824 RepID=UPI001E5A1911|nr:SpoIIE family protein phosphatase [Nocardia asteroides]UGT64836.1 SpoIIE family protein phosphatase [Nocardia asteroides]